MKYKFFLKLFICLSLFIFLNIFSKPIYPEVYKNYGAKNKGVAIVILGYNRPAYFKECIRSIQTNDNLDKFTFIFCIDGGRYSKQIEYRKIILESKIKNVIFLDRLYNYGCPKNHIDSKRFAFDWCGFEKIIVLEEDIIITPTYFTFLLNLHEWAIKKYDNIGSIQAWSYCYLSKKNKYKALPYVVENERQFSFVTYCMDKKTWNKISPFLYTYESYIDKIPIDGTQDKARSKPKFWKDIRSIKNFLFNEIQHRPLLKDKDMLEASFLRSKYEERRKREYSYSLLSANQDQVLGISFYLHGLIKLQSVVNRCIHIGEYGITTNHESFIKHGYSKIKLDFFREDNSLKNFLLIH